MHEAQDPRTPLLERVKFLAIASSNLDEFFMKRIGGLKQQVAANVHQLSVDGRTPQQQIEECAEAVRELQRRMREVYLDGDTKPSCESLGAEDFYGHSWGFPGTETDGYAAIVRAERTAKGGTLAAMVRTRDTDKISFRKSCRIRLTYKHDLGEPYNPATRTGKAPALQPFVIGASIQVPYRSCIYYYSAN